MIKSNIYYSMSSSSSCVLFDYRGNMFKIKLMTTAFNNSSWGERNACMREFFVLRARGGALRECVLTYFILLYQIDARAIFPVSEIMQLHLKLDTITALHTLNRDSSDLIYENSGEF
jgi:hypothetical protein